MTFSIFDWADAGEKDFTPKPIVLKPDVNVKQQLSNGDFPKCEVYRPGFETHDPLGLVEIADNLPSPGYAMSRDVAEQRAEVDNLNIIDADNFTLQLDFDTETQYAHFLKDGLPTLLQFVEVKRVERTISKSGNRHIYVSLYQPLNAPTRIALQAALGSDPKRELLNVLANINDHTNGVLLFETDDPKPYIIYSTDGSK